MTRRSELRGDNIYLSSVQCNTTGLHSRVDIFRAIIYILIVTSGNKITTYYLNVSSTIDEISTSSLDVVVSSYWDIVSNIDEISTSYLDVVTSTGNVETAIYYLDVVASIKNTLRFGSL